jgi:hypothetical protein
MGKVKEYMMDMQDYTEEIMTADYSNQYLEEYDVAERDAEENAMRLLQEILPHRHTVTEELTGCRKKIYKVDIDKIKALFPATDGAYIDWNDFVSTLNGLMVYVPDDDYKKAIKVLLDKKYTTRLRWLPPAIVVVTN